MSLEIQFIDVTLICVCKVQLGVQSRIKVFSVSGIQSISFWAIAEEKLLFDSRLFGKLENFWRSEARVGSVYCINTASQL